MTAHQLAGLLTGRQISSREVVESVYRRIEAVDGQVGAYLNITRESALEAADQVDRRRAAGEQAGPLAGIPVALKDNLCTRDSLTTCASRMLADFRPPYDATVVARLREAGTPFIGKTNMDEFAMGSSCENSAFFPTRNPWNLDLVPGGSSGGSAAAVAAGTTILALGSDTGGSIRQPASFCGVVGLKPTYGRVSRYGLVAYASSFDQIGPMARDARDCALLLQAIAGPDPWDSTSAPVEVPDYIAYLSEDLRGLRIGMPREYFTEGIHGEVREAVAAAVKELAALGAEVAECSLPHTEYALSAYYLIAPAEASANLARYDGVKYGLRVPAEDYLTMYRETRRRGFGPEVRRRIILGTYALSAGYYDQYYLKALKARTLVKGDFDAAFERFDLLATPTSPTVAFPAGERLDDPLAMYLADTCTAPANLAGIPAISIPCGFVGGMPVGLQLLAAPFQESRLLQAAHAFQCRTDHHRRRPALALAGKTPSGEGGDRE